jgi:methylated-DNA-[protein]-cysteine S-methyltransferase
MTRSFAYMIRVASPIGRIELTSDGESITSLSIECDGALPLDAHPESGTAVLDEAARQLTEYFAGSRREFDLPVRLSGTPFQLSVWNRLATIGWGDHSSYGQLARALGKPSASRAIGGAVGSNPVPLIIGCHRVLASNGAVTGYSGGEGIPTKLWLLRHEGITLAA